jgi:hypothetical protein
MGWVEEQSVDRPRTSVYLISRTRRYVKLERKCLKADRKLQVFINFGNFRLAGF